MTSTEEGFLRARIAARPRRAFGFNIESPSRRPRRIAALRAEPPCSTYAVTVTTPPPLRAHERMTELIA